MFLKLGWKGTISADRKGSRDRARELAARCLDDAANLGITIDDMEPEWGSVETIIFEVMQHDIDAELELWKPFAAARARHGTSR